MCIVKPALALRLGPELLWAQLFAGRCENAQSCQAFGCLRGIQEFSKRWCVPFWCLPSSFVQLVVLPPRSFLWSREGGCASTVGSTAALKPLLSRTWACVSPSHWILYPCVCVHKYIYIYKLCTKGKPCWCGGCCPYLCGLTCV